MKLMPKLIEIFEEKLKQHYPQLKDLESKYSGKKKIIETEKKKLFKKIGLDLDQAEEDLISYTEGRKQKEFFLWDVYFAEVFAEKGGFDVVIGNPPYVSLSQIPNESINNLKQQHFETFSKNADIYCLFYEKGLNLLSLQNYHLYLI